MEAEDFESYSEIYKELSQVEIANYAAEWNKLCEENGEEREIRNGKLCTQFPDARDGLTTNQRLILWTMKELGLHKAGKTMKNANIVGNTMKYLHKGDFSIYKDLCNLSKKYTQNIPLIFFQGNNGTRKNPQPVVYRYTESKLSDAGNDNDSVNSLSDSDENENSSEVSTDSDKKEETFSGPSSDSEENNNSSVSNIEGNGNPSAPSSADNEALQNLLSQAYDAEYGATGLWEENDIATEELNSLIKDYAARGGKSWGSLGGHLKDQILASLTAKIDYRKVLKNFRASILSDKKHLTRFKPSKRFGFEYMGSKREFTTKLLLAIDTSGSISNQDLKTFMEL